ncbi:PBECR4 domain-containing protein [Butyrivibrio fibrisolvens]|uniref:PBECR4 domain-containing protein n=1 Tax=Butyrivibrio fibrisolvens TaxID=831 RepID=UPI000424AEF2|nr:PBECR4 domain-containing protein [Butyrivibrio fibrisolvens]
MGVIESLNSYNNLLNTEYLITIGRKGKSYSLCLFFDKVDWFHTMGLHYLKDLEFLNVHGVQTESLYDDIISGKYKNDDFEKSRHYSEEMASRIELFGRLDNIIENLNNQEYNFYGFSKKKCPWTNIRADYLINNHARFENLMLYKKNEDLAGIIFISEMSIFSSKANMNDYTTGQTQYTVLKVEKHDTLTGLITNIFTHKNYIEKL